METVTNQSKLCCLNKTNSISSVLMTHTPLSTHTQPKKIWAFSLLPPLCLAAKPQSHDTKIPHTLRQLYLIYIFSTEFFPLCNSSFVKSHNVSFPPVFLSAWLYEKSHVKGKVKQTTSSSKPNLFEGRVAIYHLGQCKIFSLTTHQWHLSDVSIPVGCSKVSAPFPLPSRTCC